MKGWMRATVVAIGDLRKARAAATTAAARVSDTLG